jgi:cytochrome P450
LLADPAMLREVLTAGPELIDDTEAHQPISVIYGNRAVSVLDGAPHRRLRKVMLPPMRGHSLDRYRDIMAAAAERTLYRLPLGEPFALLPEVHASALEVIMAVVLGIDDAERLAQWMPAFERLLDLAVSEQMTARYFAQRFGGLRRWPALRKALGDCDRLIYAEIARRRTTDLQHAEDMLGLLMAATTEDGDALAGVEIRDNVVNLLFAGHETAATGLAWAFHWLVRNPAALARLTAEAQTDDTDVYAEAVAREAMRMCPPFFAIFRTTRQRFQLGEYLLPAGTMIAVPMRAVHRDTGLYPDPHSFDPERFLGKRLSVYNYLVFGAGAHQCMGDQYGIAEIKVFLHTMLRRATFEPVKRRPEAIRRKSLFNLPAKGCRLRMTSRRPSTVPQPAG